MKPNYIPQSESVYYEGKILLLVWCPGGYERPYKCPKKPTSKSIEKTYYIRKLSSTIEATDLDVKELIALTHNIPFDDRINIKSEMSDLKYPLIRNYLETVNSHLLNNLEYKKIEDVAKDLRVADGLENILSH